MVPQLYQESEPGEREEMLEKDTLPLLVMIGDVEQIYSECTSSTSTWVSIIWRFP